MTAEFAVLMPAMVLMLGVALAIGSVALNQVRCLDAARSAARLAARGESLAVVREAVRALGPPGARLSIARSGGRVTVRVAADVTLPLPWHPGLALSDEATARLEQP